MPTSFSFPSHFEEDVDLPVSALADRVQAVLDDRPTGSRRYVRVEVPIDAPIDPIHWLRAQETEEVVYWSGRSPDTLASNGRSLPDANGREGAEPTTIAGVGSADVLTGTSHPVTYQRLQRELTDRFERSDAAIRYFGGLRFDAPETSSPRATDQLWQDFGTYRFVLPRFELVDYEDRQVLACTVVLPRDRSRSASLLASIRSLAGPSQVPEGALPKPTRRTDRPDEAAWTDMVQGALDAISEQQLQKVVFAREVALGLERPVDPLRVFHHLKETTPGCFHFALQPPNAPTFVGASPERLFQRRGTRVESEAVAGTRKRGQTDEADAALREELLTSAKERREHAFVQRAIQEELEALCVSVDGTDTPSELALARGRHLHAKITGTLRPDVSTIDLLEALHPTPAVGGVPSDTALTAIRQQEPFDRGWYAGPVGWIGPDAADFAVAIRSGLLQPSQLALFSGAGIVEGSVPTREWDEIEQKIGDFAAVLGLLAPADEPQS